LVAKMNWPELTAASISTPWAMKAWRTSSRPRSSMTYRQASLRQALGHVRNHRVPLLLGGLVDEAQVVTVAHALKLSLNLHGLTDSLAPGNKEPV
jgi:hypothetical protein